MDSFYKSDEWADIRSKVYRRDDYRCVWCGDEDQYLNAHHVLPRAIDDDGDHWLNPINLATLCYHCHRAVHEQGAWVNPFRPDDCPPRFVRFGQAYFAIRLLFPDFDFGQGERPSPTFPDRLED